MADLMGKVGFMNLSGIDEKKVSTAVPNRINPMTIGNSRVSSGVRHCDKH